MPGVDLVLGNREKYLLPELLGSIVKRDRPEVRVGLIADAREVPAAPVHRMSGRMGGRSRAFVKIQDGCQHRCAFCIVPAARGRSRSQEPKVLVEQVEALVEAGYGEITLTGVDIGHYGWDLLPRTSLASLVTQLTQVGGLRWLRLSSVLPAYFTPELIQAVTTRPVVVPHLHLPLQSGSDRVLRRMRRPYNTAMYRTLAERLAAAIPDLGLGADVIVGHPGEEEADFEATMALVGELPLSYLHVFAYSDRKGTEAARMSDRVAASAIRERSSRLRALGVEKGVAFRRRLLGRAVEVLVLEERRADGGLTGLTSNYVEVSFAGPEGLGRRFATVRLTEIDRRGARGVLEAA
jgi:threonylcarbamoyladenosine tRNA methylthiotransferase MtaB